MLTVNCSDNVYALTVYIFFEKFSVRNMFSEQFCGNSLHLICEICVLPKSLRLAFVSTVLTFFIFHI